MIARGDSSVRRSVQPFCTQAGACHPGDDTRVPCVVHNDPESDYGVNVTITERVLSRIDSSAARRGESQSGLMTQAALEFMAEGEP